MQKNVEKFGIADKRGRMLTNVDPYQSRQGLKEPVYCGECHAVYRNKRWQKGAEVPALEAETSRTLCPACRKAAQGYVQGVMTLSGDYLWAHETEIRNLLQHAGAGRGRLALEKILRMERQGDALVIEATSDKLVEHLGRTLRKAHHGELRMVWSDGREACRVEWRREG